MRRHGSALPSAAQALGLMLASICAAIGCVSDFDTTRVPRPVATTLGEELFTALCDRVGASSFSEDLEGRSYRNVCHKGAKDWASTTVETRYLPPASASRIEQRRLSIAKVEAMARHRERLIAAFDRVFPDTSITDPLDPAREVRVHDALDLMTRRMLPLLDASEAPRDPPLVPATTRTLAATLGALSESPEARQALSRMSPRQGYRPTPMALGATRTLLAYPHLRSLVRLLLDRIGEGGAVEQKFQHLLRVVEQELRTLSPDPEQPALSVDAALLPNRPRQNLEIISELLLAQDPAFARSLVAPRYLAARDRRGFVIPLGTTPESIPAPFCDSDGDGLADVDGLGRFIGVDTQPLLVPPPFVSPQVAFDQSLFSFDPSSRRACRGEQLVYRYLDSSQSFLGSLAVDLKPLVAEQSAGASTLMKALEGARVLYGDRKIGSASYLSSGGKKSAFDYQGFDAESSPLIDLLYATGQLLGAPESDDYIGAIMDLHEQHPEKTGRALALSWALWNRSKDPAYAAAVLADTSTFWDDMADWLAKVSRIGPERYTGGSAIDKPRGMLSDLMLALATPEAAKYLPGALATPFTHVDKLSYQPGKNINGAPLNTSKAMPVTPSNAYFLPVNRGLPDQGDNRSAFQRFLHIIHSVDHVNACNKDKTLVVSDLTICGLTVSLTYPIKLPLTQQKYVDECALFEIPDLGVFFIDSILPWDHPRRANLKIADTTLTGMLDAVSKLVPSVCGELNTDVLLQKATGLDGLTTKPTPQALARLVFFGSRQLDEKGNSTLQMPTTALDPYLNGESKALANFVENSLNLVGTSGCPQTAKGVHLCTSYDKTLRGTEPGTFFVAETPFLATHPTSCQASCASLPTSNDAQKHDKQLCLDECAGPSSGFYEGIRPVLTAFASYSYEPDPGEKCAKDAAGRCIGEQLFFDLIGILGKHWAGQSSGLNRYEDFLAWAFSAQSDLFGVAQDLLPAMRDQKYVSHRVKKGQVRSSLEVTASLMSLLFDPQVSKSLGLTDRHGSKATKRNDGSPKPQVTPYDLMVHSLRGFDARFANEPEKKARWREARSALVDQFLLADATSWQNPGIARALPLLGKLLREQLNANCPSRESTKECVWARDTLPKKLAAVMEGPLFAAITDVQEALRDDEQARIELERFLTYLLAQSDDPDALALTLTAVSDLLQVLHDDRDLAPVLNTLSVIAAPGRIDDTASSAPGLTHVTLLLVRAVLDEHEGLSQAQSEATRIDRYRVLDLVLRNLVTPQGDDGQAPLEVFLDAMADVQRMDSSDESSFSDEDYRTVFDGIKRVLVDEYRGLEQFYEVLERRHAP